MDNASIQDMISLLKEYENMCLNKNDFSSAEEAKNKIDFLKTQELLFKKEKMDYEDKENVNMILYRWKMSPNFVIKRLGCSKIIGINIFKNSSRNSRKLSVILKILIAKSSLIWRPNWRRKNLLRLSIVPKCWIWESISATWSRLRTIKKHKLPRINWNKKRWRKMKSGLKNMKLKNWPNLRLWKRNNRMNLMLWELKLRQLSMKVLKKGIKSSKCKLFNI